MPSLRLPVAPVRAALGLASPLFTGEPLDIARQRSRTEAVARLQLPALRTRVERTSLRGVPAERLRPDGAVRNAALLYLHGGGYCIGSPRTHRALATRLAAAAGVAAYVPDYRLAPEHPHPAALDDALAAYRALLDAGFAAGRILVAGDSAGGGLALALAMALPDAGEPAPAAVGMICPWLDLAPDHAGGRPASGRDALLTPGALTAWARAYADGRGPQHPAVSPLHGDLRGLPPLVLHSAGDDVLAGDAERLTQRVG